MAGILVQIVLSWVIIWLFEKKDLDVLGWKPNQTRLKHFSLFFFLTALFCASPYLIRIFISGEEWKVNPVLNVALILNGTWWNIKSVLFEELIFRGVILYILARRLGAKTGIILSAVAFGIYHWFSFGVLGNAGAMVFTFLITGIMGLVLAYGYVKTLSLYIPIAIHLGWNLTKIFVFSDGPIGNGLFIPADKTPFRTDSWVIAFAVFLMPILLTYIVNFILIRRIRGADIKMDSPRITEDITIT
ncbi:MAG TPA: CPBP family intramembrane glutamic endopeptidase [Chitinophagaceae bacterium]